jgi:hypothetical protein
MIAFQRLICFMLMVSLGWGAVHVAFDHLPSLKHAVATEANHTTESSRIARHHDTAAPADHETHSDDCCFHACTDSGALAGKCTLPNPASKRKKVYAFKPMTSQFLAERIDRPQWNSALAV